MGILIGLAFMFRFALMPLDMGNIVVQLHLFILSRVTVRDVRWPKFVGTGTERNAFPFKKDLSLSSFFSFFLFPRTGLSTLSNLSLD